VHAHLQRRRRQPPPQTFPVRNIRAEQHRRPTETTRTRANGGIRPGDGVRPRVRRARRRRRLRGKSGPSEMRGDGLARLVDLSPRRGGVGETLGHLDRHREGFERGCESRGDERRRGRGGGVDVGVETTRCNGDDGGSETGEGRWHGSSVRVRVGFESRDGVGGRAEDERRELDVDDGDDVRASLRGAFVRVGIDGKVALADEGDGDARVGGERAEGGLVDGQGVAGVRSGPLEGDGARALARHGTRRGRGVFGAVGERVGYRHRGRDGVLGRVLGRRGVRGGLVGSLRERRGRGVRVGRGRRGGDGTSRSRPSGETLAHFDGLSSRQRGKETTTDAQTRDGDAPRAQTRVPASAARSP